jgi:hypothetical protein
MTVSIWFKSSDLKIIYFSARFDPCFICETAGSGMCLNNSTECECLPGFGGPTCLGILIFAQLDEMINVYFIFNS